MSPAPDCSYQSILSFNNWCRPPAGGRSWSGPMVPGPTLGTRVLTSEDTTEDRLMDGREEENWLERSCRNVWVLKVVHEQYPNIPEVQVPSTATAVGDGCWMVNCWVAWNVRQQRAPAGRLRHISRLASLLRCCAARPDPAETNCNSSHSIGHSTATEANTNLYLVWQMHFDCFCEDLNTWTRASTLKCYCCYTIQ